MLEYSESIQSMPWDTDFESECELLYNKEVVPALLEIEESTKDGSFINYKCTKISFRIMTQYRQEYRRYGNM